LVWALVDELRPDDPGQFITIPAGFLLTLTEDQRAIMNLRLIGTGISAFCILAIASCSTMEKASTHGLSSGFYSMGQGKRSSKVYVDVAEDALDIYHSGEQKQVGSKLLTAPFLIADSAMSARFTLRKTSLDIDIATIFLKYRPSVNGLPSQLNADLNVAMYAGVRRDRYKVLYTTDPLGKRYREVNSFGYDLGVFAGPGITPVNSFTTLDRGSGDYSGMVVQMGIAGFLESKFASFGVAIGVDHLLSKDSKAWIYNNKLWVGFVVGIALN
jgi:hypothetical protein